jgi:hypothetical protein
VSASCAPVLSQPGFSMPTATGLHHWDKLRRRPLPTRPLNLMFGELSKRGWPRRRWRTSSHRLSHPGASGYSRTRNSRKLPSGAGRVSRPARTQDGNGRSLIPAGQIANEWLQVENSTTRDLYRARGPPPVSYANRPLLRCQVSNRSRPRAPSTDLVPRARSVTERACGCRAAGDPQSHF